MTIEIKTLANKPRLTKSEAKRLNELVGNILPDCYCDAQSRILLQNKIKKMYKWI